jgi:hypothetical protein
MRLPELLASSLAVLSLAGCAVPAEPEEIDSAESALAAPTLTFNADWSVVQSGALVEGDTITVAYDNNRLPQCRGTLNDGRPAWSITGSYQSNGGAVTDYLIAGYSPTNSPPSPYITQAPAGDLALWFRNGSIFGCQAWDSMYGQNFHFTVEPKAKLQFNTGWTTTVTGTPRAGRSIEIDYDPARLPQCRGVYNGFEIWDIRLHYRFDGGAVTDAPLTAASTYTRIPVPAIIQAPDGAHDLEMWFENTSSYPTCTAWDSVYGQNYHFTLQ